MKDQDKDVLQNLNQFKLKEDSLENDKSNKDSIEKWLTYSVRFDVIAKAVIFIFFIVYAYCQVKAIHIFMKEEAAYPLDQRLDPSIIKTYIKYSLGFNSALILILGYWFGGNGGFSRLTHRIVAGIVDRSKQKD